MAVVRPFKGLRYNPEKIGELSSVITPPYDVITEQQQHAYYERNPYNLIRLEMGKEFPDDNPENSRYTRAAQTLAEWIREGILVREERPAFYLMEHRFAHRGSERSYWGLIAAVRLEEFDTGTIRATEITMDGPIEDRLNLLHACGVNLSPIMGAFVQKEGDLLTLLPDLDPAKPDMSGTDDFGVTFNLWVIDEANTVRELAEFFTDKLIYIADGHHRYQTALTYRKEQLGPDVDSDGPRSFVMMTLISFNDRELTMLPTHRLVRGLKPDQLATLKDDLGKYFSIRELTPSSSDSSENLCHWMEALTKAGNSGTAFGIYGLEAGKYLLLVPNDVSALYDMLPAERSLAWRKLDVSLLHWIVLRGILGIDDPEKEKKCLEYSPDDARMMRKVDEGEAQLAVFLNPAPISSVMAVADAGDRMPQKSTYFYPKTAAGLVMNPLF
jgi:uncharacterized protein (DUF1015 family)